jgi:class 3 adenylate cyclase
MEEIGKVDIRDIELGNSIIREKTTIFMDVRGFTTMSEKVWLQLALTV